MIQLSLGLGVFVLILVVVVQYLLAPNLGAVVGKWEIVSVWSPNLKRMEVQELVVGNFVNIHDNGHLVVGRGGLDGMISVVGMDGHHFRLVQNGTTWRHRVFIDRSRGNSVVFVNDEFNEVTVARRIATVPDARQ
jgi:hypothetical protein